jgi:hypothetical protein
MRNTSMIQRATLQLRTHGSVDIRIFAVSTSKTTTVTSNVAIDLSDDVEIHETHIKSEQASSLKSDLSSHPDLVSVLQGMFLPEVLDEILSAEDPVFLNRVLKNMQSDGLGRYSDIDQARYVSLKSYFRIPPTVMVRSWVLFGLLLTFLRELVVNMKTSPRLLSCARLVWLVFLSATTILLFVCFFHQTS